MSNRRILQLTGEDVLDFLQGLITNDISGLKTGLVYAAMLTPQGKYLSDFFVVPHADGVLIDVDSAQGDMLTQRLNMYRLRADVSIAEAPLHLHRGTGEAPQDGFADPRHTALGWRAYRPAPQTDDTTDWTALRVAHMIPQSGVELTQDTFILEVGFERLSGVDFRKGCYVGQEVTARMKHKTELRKGLARVSVEGPAETGCEITASGKTAGTLLSRSGDRAIAYLRYDRAQGDMQAGEAVVRRLDG
ncbi:folate-binding protein [uncultured Roseobacter sp.]|uniref:CAF17-like 4Fe-4S cluster assembly/insertion protein YgfZ n=1 Tax=uncultured Roseobacter sp. TaxID=114847 RepID=UPI00260D73FF|nr:folate-binding protein [uncultured Roseobacter sp.]